MTPPSLIRKIKREAADCIYRWTAPRRPSLPSAGKGSPCVVGFLSTPSGIGESARLCVAGLARAGLRPAAIDIAGRFGQSSDALRQAGFAADAGSGPLVVHANPPELPAVLSHLGSAVLGNRYRVGYWVWELAEAPAAWSRAARYVHEVWTPSKHSADAFAALRLDVPVRIVPHPVPLATGLRARARFGLPERAFVTAAFADFHSSLARKNPADAIAAHAQAFGDDPDAVLVVKLGRPEADPARGEALRRTARANVVFVDRPMSPAEMADLVASVDCVLSLHRAEGFGLSLAMAMRAGVPVVATAWSGNLDFMDSACSVLIAADLVDIVDPQGIYRHGQWAQPRVGEAASALRRLRDEPEWRTQIGRRGAAKLERFADPAAWRTTLGPEFMNRCEVR